MKDKTENVLKAEGYDVVAGSFGVPYRVPKEDKFSPLSSMALSPQTSLNERLSSLISFLLIPQANQKEKSTRLRVRMIGGPAAAKE
jgi:hypothetical protein